jgi:hypothetical protein
LSVEGWENYTAELNVNACMSDIDLLAEYEDHLQVQLTEVYQTDEAFGLHINRGDVNGTGKCSKYIYRR